MDLHQLLSPTQKYAFLAGAGVSFDDPSNLPVASQIVHGLLDVLNIEESHRSEFKTRFDTSELRFEQFVEQIVRCYEDRELRIFNNLSSCQSPNRNHHFLARALRAGHPVFTTNFDTLIEQAGQPLGVSIQSMYDDASVLAGKGQIPHPLYKLHGTLVDEGGNDRRSSVVALVSSMGKMGEGLALAPHFRQLLNETLQACPLIVLGYSGSDDYDILPALAQVEHPRQLIWVHHSGQGNAIEIHDASDWSQLPGRLAGVLRDLLSLGRWKKDDIFVVTGRTFLVLDEVAKLLLPADDAYVPGPAYRIPSYFYEDWKFEHALEERRDKFFIANLYESLGEYTRAIPFLLEALQQVEILSDTGVQVHLHVELAGLYLRLRNTDRGKVHVDRAEEILQGLQLTDLYAQQLNEYNAIYYTETGDIKKAVDLLETTMPDEGSASYPGYLYERARVAAQQGDHERGRGLAEQALARHRQNGNLNGAVHCLLLLTTFYMAADEYRLALDAALESLRICNLTNNFSLMADSYQARYRIHRNLGLAGKAFHDLTAELALHQKHFKNAHREAICLARMASVLVRVEEIRSKFSPEVSSEIRGYYVEGIGCTYVPADMPSAMFSIFSGFTGSDLAYIGEHSPEMDFPGSISSTMNPELIKDSSHSLVIEDELLNTSSSADIYASQAIAIAKASGITELLEEILEILPATLRERFAP